MQNILTGLRIWLLPRKWNLPKLEYRKQDFFAYLLGIWYSAMNQINVLAVKVNQTGEHLVCKWCLLSNQTIECMYLVNSYLIETVKKSPDPGPWDNKGYFFQTGYQESALGVIAYQLQWLNITLSQALYTTSQLLSWAVERIVFNNKTTRYGEYWYQYWYSPDQHSAQHSQSFVVIFCSHWWVRHVF